jgi:hypothetical protein
MPAEQPRLPQMAFALAVLPRTGTVRAGRDRRRVDDGHLAAVAAEAALAAERSHERGTEASAAAAATYALGKDPGRVVAGGADDTTVGEIDDAALTADAGAGALGPQESKAGTAGATSASDAGGRDAVRLVSARSRCGRHS